MRTHLIGATAWIVAMTILAFLVNNPVIMGACISNAVTAAVYLGMVLGKIFPDKG